MREYRVGHEIVTPCDHCRPLVEQFEEAIRGQAGQIVRLMEESPQTTAAIYSERDRDSLPKIPIMSDTTLNDLLCARCNNPLQGEEEK